MRRQISLRQICCTFRKLWSRVKLMSWRDVYADLACLAVPAPAEPDDPDALTGADREGLDAALSEAAAEWYSYRSELEHSGEWGDVDPVLSELAAARRAMLNAERRMRLLLAYAREYVRPRPYRLEDLANATGMSISGVRKAYTGKEVGEVHDLLTSHPGPRSGLAGRSAAGSAGPEQAASET